MKHNVEIDIEMNRLLEEYIIKKHKTLKSAINLTIRKVSTGMSKAEKEELRNQACIIAFIIASQQ